MPSTSAASPAFAPSSAFLPLGRPVRAQVDSRRRPPVASRPGRAAVFMQEEQKEVQKEKEEKALYEDGPKFRGETWEADIKPVSKRFENKRFSEAAKVQGQTYADAWAKNNKGKFDVWVVIGLAFLMGPFIGIAWGIKSGAIPGFV